MRTAKGNAQLRRCAARSVSSFTVRVSAVLTLALLAACASTDSSAPVFDPGHVIVAESGADVTLAIVQTARIPSANLHVSLKRLVSDSRCPVAATIQCVWGGSVSVEVEGGRLVGFAYVETRRLETLNGRDTTTLAGQLVRLVRVLPERTATDSIPVAAYRIVLRVGASK